MESTGGGGAAAPGAGGAAAPGAGGAAAPGAGGGPGTAGWKASWNESHRKIFEAMGVPGAEWEGASEKEQMAMLFRAAAAAADRARISGAVRPGAAPRPGDAEVLHYAALFCEETLARGLRAALGGGPEGRRRDRALAEVCGTCFGMLEAHPLPEDRGAVAGHVMWMLACSYAGEMRERMGRYLAGNPRAWDVAARAAGGLNVRMMAGIYLAVLRAARGEEGDVGRAAGILERLLAEGGEGGEGGGPGAARRLATLRRLAEAARLVCAHARDGGPADVEERLDALLRRAVPRGAIAPDLDALAASLCPAFKMMARNSRRALERRAGRGAAARAGAAPEAPYPPGAAPEAPYPLRAAVLEGGLLDPARGSAVAVLPAPARIAAAGLRISRALEAAPGGVAAYVIQDGASANGAAAALRRELGPPRAAVEAAGPAPYMDGRDCELASGGIPADVVVASPEKLGLMLRHPGGRLAGSLVLAVADGARTHAGAAGLALELLLSEVKHGCPRAGVLLADSYVPDAAGLAAWLDPRHPRPIAPGSGWKPSDRAVGLLRAGGPAGPYFEPLETRAQTVGAGGRFRAGPAGPLGPPAGKRGRHALAALMAARFDPSMCMLVLGDGPGRAWRMAEEAYRILPDLEPDGGRLAARRIMEDELGAGFPLAKYLDRGIGVAHPCLPREAGGLAERLAAACRLRALFAPTGAALGMRFPVSGVIMASRLHAGAELPAREFWNLAGRAGRIDRPPIGVVGLVAASRAEAGKWAECVRRAPGGPASALPGMVRGALEGGGELDLRRLAESDAGWSVLARHVAAAAGRARGAGRAADRANIALGSTYGFGKLRRGEQGALTAAAERYAEGLGGAPRPPGLALSPGALDGAGAAPEGGGAGVPLSAAGLPALVGAARSIPEVRGRLDAAAPGLAAGGIGAVLSDWVSGRSVREIAVARFGGGGRKRVAECAAAVRGLAEAAALGAAAALRIPGPWPDPGGMDGDRKARALGLPGMLYYGVDTDEAVAMCGHGVPRRAARGVGEAYGREGRGIRGGSAGIARWLEELPDGEWRPGSGSAPGADYKEAWRMLAGAGGGEGP